MTDKEFENKIVEIVKEYIQQFSVEAYYVSIINQEIFKGLPKPLKQASKFCYTRNFTSVRYTYWDGDIMKDKWVDCKRGDLLLKEQIIYIPESFVMFQTIENYGVKFERNGLPLTINKW